MYNKIIAKYRHMIVKTNSNQRKCILLAIVKSQNNMLDIAFLQCMLNSRKGVNTPFFKRKVFL